MKRLISRTLTVMALIAASLFAISVVIMIRALSARSVQLTVDAIPKIAIDDDAIERVTDWGRACPSCAS